MVRIMISCSLGCKFDSRLWKPRCFDCKEIVRGQVGANVFLENAILSEWRWTRHKQCFTFVSRKSAFIVFAVVVVVVDDVNVVVDVDVNVVVAAAVVNVVVAVAVAVAVDVNVNVVVVVVAVVAGVIAVAVVRFVTFS